MVALSNTFKMQFALFLCFIILSNLRRSKSQTTTATTTTCDKGACSENMPQLTENDPLEIKLYHHGLNDQAMANLESVLCGVVSACGDQITVKYMFGALAETSANNDLFCGAYGCDRDRIGVCRQLLAPDILNDPCVDAPIVNRDDLVSCLANAETDSIILASGEARKKLGIQMCEVPTVVFNDFYDPCVDISSSDTLISYICDMYGSTLACCSA